ncbi:MAG: hypothetical protein ACLT12_08215 [Lactococcus lactis]
MKLNHRKGGGYSRDTANNYVSSSKPILSISVTLDPQYKFEEKRRTDEVIAFKAWFSQEGLPPFTVKFDNEIELPKYGSLIEFENLQACEVGYDVYFKADNLKAVK